MKNIPSVVKEMPSKTLRSIPGKSLQKDRSPLSVKDGDAISSLPLSPIPFQRLLQDRLRVREQVETNAASQGVDGNTEGGGVGNKQLTQTGREEGFLLPAGTKRSTGRQRLISAPGVSAKERKKGAGEQRLSTVPTIPVPSRNSAMVDENREYASSAPEGTAESNRLLHGQRGVKVRHQINSEKTHDHRRSDYRYTGEYPVVSEERDSLRGNTAIGAREGNGETGTSGEVRDITGRVNDPESRLDRENTARTDAFPVLSFLEGQSGKRIRQAAAGEKSSPLPNVPAVPAGDAAPLSATSGNQEEAHSPVQQRTLSEKMHNQLRPVRRQTGEHSVISEEKGGLRVDAAIGEITENSEMGLQDGVRDFPGSVHDLEPENMRRNKGAIDGSLNQSPMKENPGERVGAVTGERRSPLPSASVVPAGDGAPISGEPDNGPGTRSAVQQLSASDKTDNHLRSVRRRVGEYSVASAEKIALRGNPANGESDRNGGSALPDDIRDIPGRVHGPKTGHESEDTGRADAFSVPSLLKESSAERARLAVTGEKSSSLLNASAVPAVDAVPISIASDDGEGMFSPGRPLELLAQVVENVRPLMQQGGGRVLISLSPPSLGTLDIDVRVKKDGVELYVVANNADAQQTLCSHVEQLRSALSEQGLNMDRFQVVVGDRSDGQLGRDPHQEGMPGGQWEARTEKGYLPGRDGETINEEMERASLSGPYPSVGGINLFI